MEEIMEPGNGNLHSRKLKPDGGMFHISIAISNLTCQNLPQHKTIQIIQWVIVQRFMCQRTSIEQGRDEAK